MKCFPLYLVLPQRLKGCYCLGDKCPPKAHLWKVWLSASGNYWQIRESLSNVTGSARPLVSHGHSYLAQQQTVLLPLRWELFSISTLNGKLGPQSFPLPLVFLHPWSERLLRHELAPPPCSPAAVCSFCPVFHRRVFPLRRICSPAMCFFCRVLLQPCVPPSPHYATTGPMQHGQVTMGWNSRNQELEQIFDSHRFFLSKKLSWWWKAKVSTEPQDYFLWEKTVCRHVQQFYLNWHICLYDVESFECSFVFQSLSKGSKFIHGEDCKAWQQTKNLG